ncbi:MAG: penicillin-binding protein 1C [Vicinamibacterales bacterium]
MTISDASRGAAPLFGRSRSALRTAMRSLQASRPRRLAACVTIGAVALILWLRLAPLPAGLVESAVSESTMVVDRNGVPLYEALSGTGSRSVALTADTIPGMVAAATVAAEDRRFWSHYGVDPLAITRAARRNLVEGRIVEGGSTITQQVAKLLTIRQAPGRRRGWIAKVHEGVLALRLEHRLSKREILALYLNLASYGNQISGLERASRAYFGVEARMLTPAQAAFLAGLPQRPTTFNPYRKLSLAQSRQRVVLRRMLAAGALSAEQAAHARDEALTFARSERPFLAPHFVNMVLANAGSNRPAQIRTTIDAELQAAVAGIIRAHRPTLERHGAGNVAVVALDNLRGEWLAWEGSGDYFDAERGGSIDGVASPRQPGSALKPFTYALAFENGVTPATVLPDVPMHFPTADPGVVYTPRNYDGRYRGPLLARAALAGSENIPAVSLASDLGVPRLLRFLHRAGFSTFDKNGAHYGLGVTLGNAEVRLDEIVAAYAAFARGGRWLAPSYLPDRGDRESRPLVSPRTAFWITDILSDDAARAYIFGRGGSLEFPFAVAVKTGTSQAYHDNWTIGYTREVTIGVWVGNFDRRPLRNSSGVTGAAPIFRAVMLAAHARAHGGTNTPAALADESLVEREVCALSGEGANAWCPVRRNEWLPAKDGVVPCSWHHLTESGLAVIWPARFREWAQKNGRGGDSPPAVAVLAASSSRPARRKPVPVPGLQIANPPSGATYLIDPTLRREFQSLQLKAVTPSSTLIEWTINGVPFSAGNSDAVVEWPLRAGRHTVTARDTVGNVDRSTFTVR